MKTEGMTEFEDFARGMISFDNALQDDLIIIKADGFPTYNFANIIDDHLMRDNARYEGRGVHIQHAEARADV